MGLALWHISCMLRPRVALSTKWCVGVPDPRAVGPVAKSAQTASPKGGLGPLGPLFGAKAIAKDMPLRMACRRVARR